MPPPLRVAILHPDLGVGGAERLIVDAALCLTQAGHRVTLFTAAQDPQRCFPETLDGSIDVRVIEHAAPRWFKERFLAPRAMYRMARLVRSAARQEPRFDVVLCDLVAHIMPLVARWMPHARRLFYCHFPDRRLAPAGGFLHRLYRWPINHLEARGMDRADLVLVNSEFTRRETLSAFPGLRPERVQVLHPGVRLFASATDAGHTEPMVLSVMRFAPEKNGELLLEAFEHLSAILPEGLFSRCRLVMAGGYDERLRNNRETLNQLRRRSLELNLSGKVSLMPGASSEQLKSLFTACRCLAYPPVAEHFGIVPVEAMAAGKPVVAVNSGGPLETVVDGETGFLCPPSADEFAQAIAQLLTDPSLAGTMGRRGPARAAEFSREVFCHRLNTLLA